jgi:Na+/H+-dicarboxylate symporter
MTLALPTLPLHNKILLALLLGAAFGVLFNVGSREMLVSYRGDDGTLMNEVIQSWDTVEFAQRGSGEVLASFSGADQLAILSYFKKLSPLERQEVRLRVRWSSSEPQGSSASVSRTFDHVLRVGKVQTIATLIKPIGTLFIRLLMFVAVPLVISSLIVGASSLGDLQKVGRIGAKTVVVYGVTTTMAITVGLLLVNLVQPGRQLAEPAREKLMVEYQANVESAIEQETAIDIVDTFVNIVATNPFEAIANGRMLQVVFFSLMVGISLTAISREKAAPVIGFFEGFSELMIRMVGLIMKIAPFGVFALIAATVAEFGFEILHTLAWYAGTLIAGFLIHQLITLGSLVRLLGGLNPVRFFRAMRPVMLIGFSSSSSAATLPVNMETCTRQLGVPKHISSFVLPLGATINMDGTSMYQAVAAVFMAQVYGLDLSLSAQLTILLTAVLASIGTAPVPGVGLIMLIIVLRAVNIPEEGIALILGVDRILDMCRTVLNVTGDAVVAVIMGKQEGGREELQVEAA